MVHGRYGLLFHLVRHDDARLNGFRGKYIELGTHGTVFADMAIRKRLVIICQIYHLYKSRLLISYQFDNLSTSLTFATESP